MFPVKLGNPGLLLGSLSHSSPGPFLTSVRTSSRLETQLHVHFFTLLFHLASPKLAHLQKVCNCPSTAPIQLSDLNHPQEACPELGVTEIKCPAKSGCHPSLLPQTQKLPLGATWSLEQTCLGQIGNPLSSGEQSSLITALLNPRKGGLARGIQDSDWESRHAWLWRAEQGSTAIHSQTSPTDSARSGSGSQTHHHNVPCTVARTWVVQLALNRDPL